MDPVNNSTNKYTLRPTDLGSSKDDFVIRFNGRDVARTYADATPNGPRWYWSIYGINLCGPLPTGALQAIGPPNRATPRF